MKTMSIHAAVLCAAVWASSCGQAAAGCGVASTYTAAKQAPVEAQSQVKMTAAHQTLPIGTRVVVRNQQKGKSIIVEITEHAPLLGSVIDLTSGAMNALGLEPLNPVCLEVVSYGSQRRGYEKMTMRDVFARAVRPLIAPAPKHAAKPAEHPARTRYARTHKMSTKHYANLHRRVE